MTPNFASPEKSASPIEIASDTGSVAEESSIPVINNMKVSSTGTSPPRSVVGGVGSLSSHYYGTAATAAAAASKTIVSAAAGATPKGPLEEVLDRALGPYLLNFDARRHVTSSSLLWNGKVTIRNLILNTEAIHRDFLDDLGEDEDAGEFPFRIVHGSSIQSVEICLQPSMSSTTSPSSSSSSSSSPSSSSSSSWSSYLTSSAASASQKLFLTAPQVSVTVTGLNLLLEPREDDTEDYEDDYEIEAMFPTKTTKIPTTSWEEAHNRIRGRAEKQRQIRLHHLQQAEKKRRRMRQDFLQQKQQQQQQQAIDDKNKSTTKSFSSMFRTFMKGNKPRTFRRKSRRRRRSSLKSYLDIAALWNRWSKTMAAVLIEGGGDEAVTTALWKRLVVTAKVRMELRNVNFRVQHKSSASSPSDKEDVVVAGIRLDSICLQTKPDNSSTSKKNRKTKKRRQSLSSSSTSPLFLLSDFLCTKSLQIQGLGLYCDDKVTTPTPSTAVTTITTESSNPAYHPVHAFVLEPLSFEVHLYPECNETEGEESKQPPSQFYVSSTLPPIRLLLVQRQLEIANTIVTATLDAVDPDNEYKRRKRALKKKRKKMEEEAKKRRTRRRNKVHSDSTPRRSPTSQLSHSLMATGRADSMLLLSAATQANTSTKSTLPSPSHSNGPAILLFPQYRPSSLPTDSPLDWWRYSVRCVGRLTRQRSWTEFFLAYQKCRLYVRLYVRHNLRKTITTDEQNQVLLQALFGTASSSGSGTGSGAVSAATSTASKSSGGAEDVGVPLSEEEAAQLRDIECDMSISVEGIMFWRNIGDEQIDRLCRRQASKSGGATQEPQVQRQSIPPVREWIKAIFAPKGPDGKNGSAAGSTAAFSGALSIDDIKSIEEFSFQDIADDNDDEDEGAPSLPSSFKGQLLDVRVALTSLILEMRMNSSDPLAVIEVSKINTQFSSTSYRSKSFTISVCSIQIDDLATAQTMYPCVWKTLTPLEETTSETGTRKRGKGHDVSPILTVHQRQDGDTGDQDLSVTMGLFEIVVSPVFLMKVQEFLMMSPLGSRSVELLNEDTFEDALEEEDDNTQLSPTNLMTVESRIDGFVEETINVTPKEKKKERTADVFSDRVVHYDDERDDGASADHVSREEGGRTTPPSTQRSDEPYILPNELNGFAPSDMRLAIQANVQYEEDDGGVEVFDMHGLGAEPADPAEDFRQDADLHKAGSYLTAHFLISEDGIEAIEPSADTTPPPKRMKVLIGNDPGKRPAWARRFDTETSARVMAQELLECYSGESIMATFTESFEAEANAMGPFTMGAVRMSSVAAAASDQLSISMREAWNDKIERKHAWNVRVRMRAPVLIFPESCTMKGLSFFVDLGSFHLTMGEASEQIEEVKQWFRDFAPETASESIEYAKMEWTGLGITAQHGKDDPSPRTVLSPVSMGAGGGLDMKSLGRPAVLSCLFAEIPVVSAQISPSILGHVGSLTSMWNTLALPPANLEIKDSSVMTDVLTGQFVDSAIHDDQKILLAKVDESRRMEFHGSLVVERSILTLESETSGFVECNISTLSSVVDVSPDGSSSTKVAFGHMWVMNNLSSPKLLLFSELPTALDSSVASSSDIEKEINRTEGELASPENVVTIQATTGDEVGTNSNLDSDEESYETEVVAILSSMSLNWNSAAVSDLMALGEALKAKFESNVQTTGLQSTPSMVGTTSEGSIRENSNFPNASMRVELKIRDLNIACFDLTNEVTPAFVLTATATNGSMRLSKEMRKLTVEVAFPDCRLEEEGTKVKLLFPLKKRGEDFLLARYSLDCSACGEDFVGGGVLDINATPFGVTLIRSSIERLVKYVVADIIDLFGAEDEPEAEDDFEAVAKWSIQAPHCEVFIPKSTNSEEKMVAKLDKPRLDIAPCDNHNGKDIKVSTRTFDIRNVRNSKVLSEPMGFNAIISILPVPGNPDDETTAIAIDMSKLSVSLSREDYILLLDIAEQNICCKEEVFTAASETAIVDTPTLPTEKEDEPFMGSVLLLLDEVALEIDVDDVRSYKLALGVVKTKMQLQFLENETMLLESSIDDISCKHLENSECFEYLVRLKTAAPHSSIFKATSAADTKSSSLSLIFDSPRICLEPERLESLISFFLSAGLPSNKQPNNGNRRQDTRSDKLSLSVRNVQLGFMDRSDALLSSSMLLNLGSNLQESLVLEGSLQCCANTGRGDKDDITEFQYNVHGEKLQIYSARGSQLGREMQILEPLTIKAAATMGDSNKQAGRCVDVTLGVTSKVNVTFSTQNALQVQGLVDGFHEMSARTQSVAVVEGDVRGNASEQQSSPPDYDGNLIRPFGENFGQHTFSVSVPEINTTLVTHLRGLDQELFKVSSKDLMVSGENDFDAAASRNGNVANQLGPTLKLKASTSLMADYFNPKTRNWESCFVDPWKIAFSLKRDIISPESSSPRMATGIDLNLHRCAVSISQHVITSVAAVTHSWSTLAARDEPNDMATVVPKNLSEPETQQGQAVRDTTISLLSIFPYWVENLCGIDLQLLSDDHNQLLDCPTGATTKLQLSHHSKKQHKSGEPFGRPRQIVNVFAADKFFLCYDFNEDRSEGHQTHKLPSGQVVCSRLLRMTNGVVLQFTSQVIIRSEARIPFMVAVSGRERRSVLGVCAGADITPDTMRSVNEKKVPKTGEDNSTPTADAGSKDLDPNGRPKPVLSVPVDMLTNGEATGEATSISLVPLVTSLPLSGKFDLPKDPSGTDEETIIDVVCSKSENDEQVDSIAFRVCLRVVRLQQDVPLLEILVQPRTVLVNCLPCSMAVLAAFAVSPSDANKDGQQNMVHEGKPKLHTLCHRDYLESYCPYDLWGVSSMAVDVKAEVSEDSVRGFNWLELPLTEDPVKACTYEFSGVHGGRGITDFVVSRHAVRSNKKDLSEDKEEQIGDGTPQYSDLFYLTIGSYVVDHTDALGVRRRGGHGQPCFGWRFKGTDSHLLPSLRSRQQEKRRFTLLPQADGVVEPLILGRPRKANQIKPFRMSDTAWRSHGTEMTVLRSESMLHSGFCAYRRKSRYGQTEIHLASEYSIQNSSRNCTFEICVQGDSSSVVELPPLGIVQLGQRSASKRPGLSLSIKISESGVKTKFITVPEPGNTTLLKVARKSDSDANKKNKTTTPLLLAIKTTHGRDTCRFAVTLWDVSASSAQQKRNVLFQDDFIRTTVLAEAISLNLSSSSMDGTAPTTSPLAKLAAAGVTVDLQRILENNPDLNMADAARSEQYQLSAVLKRLRLLDCTAKSNNKVVFDLDLPVSEEQKEGAGTASALDVCVRARGPIHDLDMITLDSVDVNFGSRVTSAREVKTEKFILSTSEDFLWSLLDIRDEVVEGIAHKLHAAEGTTLWLDQEGGDFIVTVCENPERAMRRSGSCASLSAAAAAAMADSVREKETLFRIGCLRVSPIMVVLNFERRAQESSRYIHWVLDNPDGTSSSLAAPIHKFLLQKVNFRIRDAPVNLDEFTTREVQQGPLLSIWQTIQAQYMTKLREDVFDLLGSVQFRGDNTTNNNNSNTEGKVHGLEGGDATTEETEKATDTK